MKPLGLDRWWIIPSNPKAILGKTSQKRSLWSSMVIFEGRILGMNATAHQIRICDLMEEPWKASHHFTNCSNRFRDQLIEIILIFGCYPYLFVNWFSLLFLV
jgi:hypothetical protein